MPDEERLYRFLINLDPSDPGFDIELDLEAFLSRGKNTPDPSRVWFSIRLGSGSCRIVKKRSSAFFEKRSRSRANIKVIYPLLD